MPADEGTAAGLREALARADGVALRREAAAAGDRDEAWALLARAGATGDGLATEVLLEELDRSGTVHRFVGRSLLDEHAVDDVVQETLISVAQSLVTFEGTAKVTTWVHRIVQRRVVDHLRRSRATTALPPDDLAPSARISSMIATRASVRDAVAALPETYRLPVEMRDLQGLTPTEIAERLGRPVGTVKAQVSRGRALVAGALEHLR